MFMIVKHVVNSVFEAFVDVAIRNVTAARNVKTRFEQFIIHVCESPSCKPVIRDVGVYRHSDMLRRENSIIQQRFRILYLLKMFLDK